MALASKMGWHRGFVCATMGDVEMMAVDSRVEGLSGFSYILETTPPALYQINYVRRFAGGALENVLVVTNMGQVLHLLALQRKLPGDL